MLWKYIPDTYIIIEGLRCDVRKSNLLNTCRWQAMNYNYKEWKMYKTLSIGNWVLHCIVQCYRNSKLFFHLAKFDNFKDKKISAIKLTQLHKSKTCWTRNSLSSGIISNFWGQLFYVLVGKTFFFLNIVASVLKSCVKWS